MPILQTRQSNMGCKRLDHNSGCKQYNDSFIHLKALLFLFVKILKDFRLSLLSVDNTELQLKYSLNNQRFLSQYPVTLILLS